MAASDLSLAAACEDGLRRQHHGLDQIHALDADEAAPLLSSSPSLRWISFGPETGTQLRAAVIKGLLRPVCGWRDRVGLVWVLIMRQSTPAQIKVAAFHVKHPIAGGTRAAPPRVGVARRSA